MTPEIATEVQIQQAVMSAKLQRLQDDVEKLSETMERFTKAVNDLNATISEAKGGWKMLLLVAGASAAISSAIGYLFHWLK
jgi:uncharacterized protein YoxC